MGKDKVRLRWENILPAGTVICLLVAGILFWQSSGELFGHQNAANTGAPPAGTMPPMGGQPHVRPAALTRSEVRGQIAQARGLMKAGRYAAASSVLDPLASYRRKFPQIRRISARLAAMEAKNNRLEAAVGRAQGRGDRYGVITALEQLRTLHPLSPAQSKLLTQARTGEVMTAKVTTPAATKHHRHATGGGTAHHSGSHRHGSGGGSGSSTGSGHVTPAPPGANTPTGSTGGGAAPIGAPPSAPAGGGPTGAPPAPPSTTPNGGPPTGGPTANGQPA
jgi:hypothetical protein